MMRKLNRLWQMTAIRLAAQLSLGFALILLAGWLAMLWFVERELIGAIDQRLQLASETAYDNWQAGSPAADNTDLIIAVQTADGTVIGPRLPKKLWRRPGIQHDPLPEHHTHEEQRWLIAHYGDVKIAVGHSLDRLDEVQEILHSGFAWMSGLALAAIIALAGGTAWRTQRRIRRIERGLARIARGDFTTRLADQAAIPDDLGRLAERIDQTTARTAKLLSQIKTQSANIAHDLRTPLARLRAGLEAELNNNPSPAVIQALEQTDDIIETFNALLRIAAISSGRRRTETQPIALATLAQEACSIFEPVVADAGQTLECVPFPGHIPDPGQTIQGDRELLLQLLGNLIENARRYAAAGGTITIFMGTDRLAVQDGGPGIPKTHRQQVLEPFFRLDATRQTAGTGLGLALVQAVAELHDAELTLRDRPDGQPGLFVDLQFPSAAQ